MPSRIGIGANASQRDMLGYSSSTFLEDQQGFGYGVGVWAEWDLGKKTQPIEWEWPAAPPYYLARPGASDPIVIEHTNEAPPETSRVEAALAVGDKVNGWSPIMQLGFWLTVALIVYVGGKKCVDRYLSRKPKAQQ